jgi:hypothetical protein
MEGLIRPPPCDVEYRLRRTDAFCRFAQYKRNLVMATFAGRITRPLATTHCCSRMKRCELCKRGQRRVCNQTVCLGALWQEPLPLHTVENLGGWEFNAVHVEIKDSPQ